jgi:amino acid transporter
MSSIKKFGTFAGVFTPSLLTILGVIMYMRLGWVVGNAGLIGAIGIILLAHVISVSTGLSVSSIATDKKIGAGGIYYVLSRSMGIPIGGSIGIALYVGTAFSIALYLIGFAESFNNYFGFGNTINSYRVTGSIALILLTALAIKSTSVALKSQYIILAAIVVSLISIFIGTSEYAPETIHMFSTEDSVSLEVVFAIFFPAVTGFTAGIAMSGDLKDPKKSIPSGTLYAIGVGLIVYIALAVFLAFKVDAELLKSDYNVLMKVALFAPAVVAGIWGATLSSALGGILGGPRILQAMSKDKVTPRIFAKGRGKNNEPVLALLLVFVIAEAGILIGELDVIARVVSMFYLAAYGFINITFFLESWANPDFQPTFKVKRWVGLIGFVACFGVMFKLDMVAMILALAVIGGLYMMLQRKEVKLQSNDIWKNVWENVVNKGLKRIDNNNVKNANWNPNIILFSGQSEHQKYLLELCKAVAGRTGIITNFKLIVDKENTIPFKKVDQKLDDPIYKELGIFARQIKVTNLYSGIANIATTFGFSGIEPNTIMMGWPKGLEQSTEYAQMTETLLHLDYNLLYLDFDYKTKFGNYKTVDLWWRETDSKNA